MAMRILLADDHVLVRQDVRVLLKQAVMVVVGEAADGPEALQLAEWPRDGPPAAGDRAPHQDYPYSDTYTNTLY